MNEEEETQKLIKEMLKETNGNVELVFKVILDQYKGEELPDGLELGIAARIATANIELGIEKQG